MTGDEAEITCPTFSAISLFTLGMTSAVPHTFTKLECTVTADIAQVTQYCQRWRLKPSTSKTVLSVFHLHNTCANRQLSVIINGKPLKHDAYPVNLAVTLEHILKYKQHLSKTAAKLKIWNNLLSKLAGTSWGAYAKTLRTSALAPCATLLQSTVVQHGRDPVIRHPSTANLTIPCVCAAHPDSMAASVGQYSPLTSFHLFTGKWPWTSYWLLLKTTCSGQYTLM